MILRAYAFLDTKAGVWSLPCFFMNDPQALRAAATLAADRDTMTGKHPHDFAFFHVGSYDDQVGLLLNVPPESLGVLSSFLVPKGHPDEA